jgi:ferredoxin
VREGVEFAYLVGPLEVRSDASGAMAGLRCAKMALGAPDASGRRRPEPTGQETILPADVVIAAIGMAPDTRAFAPALPLDDGGIVTADRETLRTGADGIFAGEGRRAAFMIDRWLTGGAMQGFDDRLPAVDKASVLARQKAFALRPAAPHPGASDPAPQDFSEIEPPLTEAEMLDGAARCLDCAVCAECEECVKACPVPDCIDLHARDQELDVEVGAVVLATGFDLFPADAKPEYGYGTFKNVITAMQMDRLLAPTRPYNTILRPGDGKVPDRIAYILCTGSRDEQVGNPLCSRFCCMYSIKQNQLIMGSLPLADVTVHYMDIRAAGKKYEEFYQQARGMGANYVRGRVAKITETTDGNLVLHYEDIENGGKLAQAEYDLVVLAVGVKPNSSATELFPEGDLALDEFKYIAEPDEDVDPGLTSIPGVYVAGSASAARDITESILHAGATAAQVAAHLERSRVDAVEVPA